MDGTLSVHKTLLSALCGLLALAAWCTSEQGAAECCTTRKGAAELVELVSWLFAQMEKLSGQDDKQDTRFVRITDGAQVPKNGRRQGAAAAQPFAGYLVYICSRPVLV